MTPNTFSVVNSSTGIKWNCRILNRGDKYGLNYCLTHNIDKPLVEFYDSRFPHTEYGQFVCRYWVETILESANDGLILDFGIPNWQIDADQMQQVRQWLLTYLQDTAA